MTDPAQVHRAQTVSSDARCERAGLQVASCLADFVESEALSGTQIAAGEFWEGFAAIVARFTPGNRGLLRERDAMQARIDAWHRQNPGAGGAPESFLREIGYLVEEPAAFTIGTRGVDREIAAGAGPQLVVPARNARFVLNAANARWGSLYDALYGTDALDGVPPPAGPYNRARGSRVVAWSRDFLDAHFPLAGASWHDWRGDDPALRDPRQLVGRSGANLLLRHNGLHVEIVIDRASPIGAADLAGIADVRLEAALTTIVDLEDSIAAVDAEEKVEAYRNWLGVLRGDLTATFDKDGRQCVRRCEPDREWFDASGTPFNLPGRSLLLVRNVGHLMTTPAVLDANGHEVFEGLLDAAITSLCALHDLLGPGAGRNSRTGSIYVVKPKMHGPGECAFANELFDAVEDLLGLARNTIKIGVMDEERRTSANLAACIHAVRNRVFFINTGFLDRTGDEIRTSMLAGPMLRKSDIKQAAWIAAYEDRNVQIGLACGFAGRAQIGKGMWAMPECMHEMLAQKIGHPMSGASTAWVPSPTAAVLHAVHYHCSDVAARQAERAAEPIAPLGCLLEVPLAGKEDAWTEAEVCDELENNLQGILGYVVRWIDQGIGCSKVPDIRDIGLMEDRATLRISSQHVANWLLHRVVSEDEIDAALKRMARKVDAQNAADRTYRPLIPSAGSIAFRAARSLVFEALGQPNGYTEPLLHRYRKEAKDGCCAWAPAKEAKFSLENR
ncbi:malate synthase G [Croceibacterium aestuarii]|uniref:malate synthase G n=1 Tax=Croceibacterium aestuarii TaxID=3064139 RepID=UPI00272EB0F0|nr:malate synthase G [Croceibacterium sp. D39]